MEFVLIIIIVILIILLLKKNKTNASNYESELRKAEQDLKLRNAELLNQYNTQLAADRQKLDNELEARRQSIRENLVKYENDEKELIKKNLEDYKDKLDENKQAEKEAYELLHAKEITTYNEGLQAYNAFAQEEIDKINETIEALNEEVLQANAFLADYKKKVDATNAEIKRQRELEEQADYYRIQLSQDGIEDIATIQSIRDKIHKREYLDKMVYDNYISKSVKEMIKRVVGVTDISGIYRITNMKTNESYVGKSVHIGERWVGHVKSACGLEGVADSQFQRALKKYGIENWTFEVIEACPKDQLTEREKFYIDFYGTKEFGYNQRMG